MPTNKNDLTMRNSPCSACVPTTKAASSSWRRMSAVHALYMAALITLCMPVRANAGTEHVFYVGEDGHVRELWFDGHSSWQGNDLTADTHGPVAVYDSGLTGFFDGAIYHVFYISSGDRHVRELYFNGGWWGNDLTAETNGPPRVRDPPDQLLRWPQRARVLHEPG